MSTVIALDPAAVRQAIAALQALLPAPIPQAPPIGQGVTVPRERTRPELAADVATYMRTRPYCRASAHELQLALGVTGARVRHALQDLMAEGVVVLTAIEAPRLFPRGKAPRYYRAVSRQH